jgi:hypothetical protein
LKSLLPLEMGSPSNHARRSLHERHAAEWTVDWMLCLLHRTVVHLVNDRVELRVERFDVFNRRAY